MKNHLNHYADFYEGGIFHVYNRTNNKELLFKSAENTYYFLRQYQKYLHPFVDTFCWNLLPTHFHFLVRVKTNDEIAQFLHALPRSNLKSLEKKYLLHNATTELLLELEWKRFFNSYAMAFNKQNERSGNLFQRPFKRVEVIKESHFTQAIIYIHANAQHHKLCRDFRHHEWSSWHSILSDKHTLLRRDEILEWFGGKQRFVEAHEEMTQYYYECDVAIEEND